MFARRARDLVRWTTAAPRDSALARLAAAADAGWGVLHRDEILALGVSPTTLDRWVAERRLAKVHARVFAVGHAQLRVEAWLYAALVASGAGAVLSHDTAAWWLGLTADDPARVHVSTPRSMRETHSILRHRLRDLHPDDITIHRGLPTTTAARTLLDIAAGPHRDERDLPRLLREAAYLRLVDREALLAVLGRARGHRGAKRLRAAVERHHPELALARSELEARFVELMRSERLGGFRMNERIEAGRRTYTVDALWTQSRLVVELDGWQAHGTRQAFEDDRRRDRAQLLAGYRVMRFTWREVVHDGRQVADQLRRALRR